MSNYRVTEDWMGSPCETLADVWPEEPRAMVVGLNPAPKSVEAGHYYQGAAGQRQMRRLVDAGIVARFAGSYIEEVALVAGIGFTDIVKRPTAGEGGVSKAEIVYGAPLLASKLEAYGVNLIICVFRHPVKALLGTEGSPGLIEKRTTWGGRIFRMPGPYEAADSASRIVADLRNLIDG